MIGLMLLGVSLLFAIIAYFVRSIRLYLSGVALVLNGIANGLLFSDKPTIWGLLALCFGIYQILNIARLTKSRLHAKHLKLAFFVGGSRLLVLQLLMLALSELSLRYGSFNDISVLVVRYLQVFAALVLCAYVFARLVKAKPKKISSFMSDSELPSISILIPARNEDTNLEEVLRSVVASDYPKMEVIVLDDCSTSSRIPEIVKEFAHDGVRFIQGSETKDNWLAKNQAYNTLVENASGDYVVFMGVDVRLGVTSLRALTNYLVSNKLSMVSVMPTRFNPTFWKGFISPLRYMRELIRPGSRFSSVPTLSSLWMIRRISLDDLGGMGAVARKVIPEQFFASNLAKQKQYQFLRNCSDLKVSTTKIVSEQLATTIRVVYPGQHRQLERNVLANTGMFVFIFLPFMQLVHALIYCEVANAVLSGIAVVALVSSHLAIVMVTDSVPWPLALINLPYLALQEISLSIISMYRYEFSEVYWKGRNICLPVMQVIAHLPKID
jgi:chlorobactene glucosyltransferase